MLAKVSSRAPSTASRGQRVVVRASPVVSRFGGRDGAVIDRPDVDIKRQGWDSDKDMSGSSPWMQTEIDKGGNGTDRQKGSPPGGGDYRVILLDDPKHTEKRVVAALTSTIPGYDEARAQNAYATSKQIGMAIVTTCLKEYAEMYTMMLYRAGLRTTMEKDSSASA